MRMSERSSSWTEELASLVNTGVRYHDEYGGDDDNTAAISSLAFETKSGFVLGGEENGEDGVVGREETVMDQVKGFLKAWGEMLLELGKGCKDIVEQNFLTEDSFIVQNIGRPVAKVSKKLSFLNEYLPEDRDPVLAWPVVFSVFILALAVLIVSSDHDNAVPPAKKLGVHPPNASHVLLPDGRRLAYLEQGVPADRARFTVICPHSFLSSRLAGIPGVKISLLEEFGIRLITYDLPGFGESDVHPGRNLNSSALDMQHLADAVNVDDKFWVMGYSSGAMHAWAALKYIPDSIAGAIMLAPMVNPYDSSMTREESQRTWNAWTRRRKAMFFLARNFPKLLSFFYRRSFLSGEHGTIDSRLSLTLGRKDRALLEEPKFEEFWHRDVEEAVRQGNTKPFIEEAALQVSNWGFSLAGLKVQKCRKKGILPWLMFVNSETECEFEGFLGPIHIWQGMDDRVVPPSIADFIARNLPEANVHKFPNEGHFSYFYFCNECHMQIFSSLFGAPQGPLDKILQIDQTSSEGHTEEVPLPADSTIE